MPFTVFSVLADGNPWDVLTTESPLRALQKLDSQRNRYKTYGPKQFHAIYDKDDPERGNYDEDELREDTKDWCADCGYPDPEHTCRWRGLP